MVFESLVVELLNKYVGNYVENLDAKQLKVGIWSGDVVLKNLILRENLFDTFNLPLKLTYGTLGKLVLKIPWTRLYSDNIVLNIEDLYILVGPQQAAQYDAEKEAKYELESKKAKLQCIADAEKQKQDQDKPRPDQSFMEKLTAQIVNNIQVKITNIHIRYEDKVTTGFPLSFGTTLHKFDIFTTDSNWEKSYMAEQLATVHKVADLDSLSVYMNCRSSLFTSNDVKEYVELFQTTIATSDKKPEGFNYVVGPISCLTQLQLNMNPQYDSPPFKIPKVMLNLSIQKLNIELTRTQFQAFLEVGDSINRMKIAAPYRKYRPYDIPYKGHSKEWWKFAITCVLEEFVRKKTYKMSWKYIKEHLDLVKTYTIAYREMQLASKPTADMIKTCDLCEQKLDVHNIRLVRRRVDLEVEKKKEKEDKEAKKSWLASWWGSKKTSTDESGDDLIKKFEEAITPEEKKKLYSAIGYEENAAQLILPEPYEAVKMNFKLLSLEIIVVDELRKSNSTELDTEIVKAKLVTCLQRIITLKLSKVTCSVDQRPGGNALKMSIGVKEFTLTGFEKNNFIPTIVKSQVSDEFSLLELLFETNPLDKKCHRRMHALARPLLITYDARTINELMSVIMPPSNISLSELEVVAASKLQNIKERSATGMQYLIDTHDISEVKIRCMPNIIIIPHSGIYFKDESSIIVISLGELSVTSQPRGAEQKDVQAMAQSGTDRDTILQVMMERAYDQFNIAINDIQVLVVKPKENWNDVLKRKEKSLMHILRPTSLILTTSFCVIPDDPRLPKTKVKILIPTVSFSITEERVFEALNVVTTIPLPQSVVQESTTLEKMASAISASMTSLAKFYTDKDKHKNKEKPKAEEIVQYTDLDLSFTLSEFGVTMYKEKEIESQKETPSSEKFDTPEVEFRSDFNDEASFLHSFSYDKMLSFKIIQLETTLVKKTYEIAADVKLGAVKGIHHYKWGEQDTDVEIINTPGYTSDKQYLLMISYFNANINSPEFTTKYNSTEQLITINFTSLVLTLHQECLLKLMQISNRFQQKFEEISDGFIVSTSNKDRIASAGTQGFMASLLETILEENVDNDEDEAEIESNEVVINVINIQEIQQNEKDQKVEDDEKSEKKEKDDSISVKGNLSKENLPSKPRRSKKIVECINLKIIANMGQVAIEITSLRRPIASIRVEHFKADVIIKPAYKEISIKLRDIIIIDNNPLSIHKQILSIVGDEALSCQFIFYDNMNTVSYNLYDMKIDINIGCVKILFLRWFVTSLLTFFNNFQVAQQALANAGAAAAETAKQTAAEAYAKATRVKINIKIKAPLILIPMNSRSLDGLALDLGFLSVTNIVKEIEVESGEERPVIIDEINLELKEMKAFKVKMIKEDEIDEEALTAAKNRKDVSENESECEKIFSFYGIYSDVKILDPITFGLVIQRNLTFGWHKQIPQLDISGHLESVKINLSIQDYLLMISILNDNLSEGQDEFLSSTKTSKRQHSQEGAMSSVTVVDVHRSEAMSDNEEGVTAKCVDSKSSLASKSSTKTKKPSTTCVTKAEKLREINTGVVNIVFGIKIDGFVANLFTAENIGLAKFGLHYISIKGKQLVNGTVSASIVLVDIQLEDIRPNNENQITKYLKHKEGKKKDFVNEDETISQYMLDIATIIKDNDIFAEVQVCGFELIICINFLISIAEFFKIPEKDSKPQAQFTVRSKGIDTKPLEKTQKKKTTSNPVNPNQIFHIVLHLEQPEIVLVESMVDINTHAIIFSMEALIRLRTVGEKKLIYGEIRNLMMYMCAFAPEKRELTRHFVIHPCTVSLQGSTPTGMGLNISLTVTNIVINISPATLELINKAICTVSYSESKKKDGEEKQMIEYNNIWDIEEFDENNFWFIKVDEAVEALESVEVKSEEIVVEHKPEVCIIEVPSIMIIFAAGIGYYTTPMLYIETKVGATIHDWSSQMKIIGNLNLSMTYYNSTLAEWEPLIEQNERCNTSTSICNYSPWELDFKLEIEKNQSSDPMEAADTVTNISVNSKDVLELTVTKSCLELLQMLVESFSQAFDTKGLIKPDIMSSYIFENDTGLDITIDFTKGIFTMNECHMPQSTLQQKKNLNSSLVLRMDDKIHVKPEDIKSCLVAAGGRVYLQKKEIGVNSLETVPSKDYLHILVGDVKKEISLPVSKADKRYFPLYKDTTQESWGIISEVKNEYGTTKINIHGVLKIKNHFTTSIFVHKLQLDSTEIIVGEIGPGKVYNVPLHAIYCPPKDLYFSLAGYKRSVQGVSWDDSLPEINYEKQLQCDPVSTFEPFYINAIREKTEVFFEVSSKFTLVSAYYTFHLRPPLYLRNALPIEIHVSVVGCSVRQDGIPKGIEAAEETNAKPIKEDFLDYGEKTICPGDILHLPTVKPCKTDENCSYIVVRLIQYLDKDWSCTTRIQKNNDEYAVWTFSSYDYAVRMDMDLGVIFKNRHGSLELTIYCPFWMVNKTGLVLSYRNTESINVLYHPPNYDGPILFSFREKNFFEKKRAVIRVDVGEWSKKIPLDVAGSTGSVECKANDMIYHIGVHNYLTHNSLTKLITFLPFYVAINKAPFEIEVQDAYRPADPWIKIPENECIPLWPKIDTEHMLRLRIVGEDYVSVPFKYTEMQCTLLAMKNKYGGVNVDVQATEGGIYLTFSQYHPGDAPGLIINHTERAISYWEKGNVNERIIGPHQKELFTWTDPSDEKILLWNSGKFQIEHDLRRDGVGQFQIGESDDNIAYWVSFLDGAQRVLLFTERETIAHETESSSKLEKINQKIEVSISGIGLSVINNVKPLDVLYLRIASSGVIWESKKRGKVRFKQMKIAQNEIIEAEYQKYLRDKQIGNNQNKYFLDGDKQEIDFNRMILMKMPTSEKEIRRTFYPGLWLQTKTSPFQLQVHAKINRLQVDNQLSDCIFPVLLAPIAPPKSVAATQALKPFVECSIVQRVVPYSSVKQFKYFSMLVQEFQLKVDLLVLSELVVMFTTETSDEEAAKKFTENVDWILRPLVDFVQTNAQQQQKHFVDYLHLGPIKIHLSFSVAGVETKALPSILSTLIQGVGVTLTDVNDVVLRLAFFEREYQCFTREQLITEITTHYSGQAIKQFYVLALGLDVLGNPYGLVVGIKKGVEDLFYEPFQGAIQGPGEFAEGLVLGVKSLFGHTVGGAAGAVSRITGAMGKGLAVLTFDKDYQRKRREAMNKRPTNFQEGIARSGKGLVMGVVDGVAGVFVKPITGAKQHGVGGFFKGLGKGAVGLVARPTAGMVDFASGSLDAVKRATESSADTLRIRPPRFIQPNSVIRAYSYSDSLGNKILKEIEKGKYATTDTFYHLEMIVDGKEILLISNHRVIYVTKSDLFGVYNIHWTYRWCEINAIKEVNDTLEITLNKEEKKFFSSSECPKKVIFMPYRARREYVIKLIEKLLQDDST